MIFFDRHSVLKTCQDVTAQFNKNLKMNDPLNTMVNFITLILTILTYAIIIRALLSWIGLNPNNPLAHLLNKVTDPIIKPLDQIFPPIGGLNFTPVIAIVLIQLAQRFLPRLLGVY